MYEGPVLTPLRLAPLLKFYQWSQPQTDDLPTLVPDQFIQILALLGPRVIRGIA